MPAVRPLVCAAFALWLIAAPASAEAQTPVYRFAIPAGPISAVMAAFRDVTAVTVEVPAEPGIQAIGSAGLTGVFTVEQALEMLLRGTGLSFRLTTANTYMLEL